ncbi:MAG: Holliday junction branch migration protein RuvA [Microbacteriaceae bacterium]
MLATVRGTVTSVGLSTVVIEASGVGYEVFVPRDLALSLRVGSEALLHTVLIPREDEWLLFGFLDTASKELFQLLRGVTGVGPKTALAVLSTLSTDEIGEAVSAGDDTRFRGVPGIGQKTASLIIVSLTGKMPQSADSGVTDLTAALTGLGWGAAVASTTAREVVRDNPSSSLSDRIRSALASLGGIS